MSNRRPISTFLGIAAGAMLATSGSAAVINVPGDFGTIQAAIADPGTVAGDEIVVAPGTYNEAINFLGKAITVRSTDPNDAGVVLNTIINGGGLGSVVICNSGEGSDTVLSGFVITGGNDVLGGGMFNSNSSPTVTNCSFSGNMASFGGGMLNSVSSPTVSNCTFSGNTASSFGGGMRNFLSSPTLTNCTFSGNAAADGGGMFNDSSSSPTVANCIWWDNSPDEIVDLKPSMSIVSYSDVQGGWPGPANIDADPLFVDPLNGDFRLQPGSPCIDAADNTAVPAGTTTDLGGNPRFVDDLDTPNTGNGTPPIVDMGAYELQGIACLADIDNNGVVEVADLVILLDVFGTADPNSDVNYDGVTNVLDLIDLLLAFGTACP